MTERLPSDESARQRLGSFWKAMVLWGISHHRQFRFQELYNNSPYINGEVEKEVRERFSFIYGAFERGIEQGLFRSANKGMILAQYYASIKGFIAYAMEEKLEEADIENELNHSFELLTGGLFS